VGLVMRGKVSVANSRQHAVGIVVGGGVATMRG